ncbi:MAG: SseB family protein, partial [Oscillospiraceae bacterium]|nr:SseB family protein [Oscillospiraceae bacterium]
EVLNEQAAAKEEALRAASQRSEDLAAEQQSPKEAANAAAQEKMGLKTSQLINEFYENQNNDTFKAVLDALVPSVMIVPVTPVSAKEENGKKQFSPALIKNQEGETFFAVFTDKSQIPQEYGQKFSNVMLPFAACCDLAVKIPACEKMIVNPFTKQFIVNANLLGAIADTVKKQREKRAVVEFSTPEPETAPLVEFAVKWFKEKPEIKNVYFSKMKRDDKITYVFIIDCPPEKHPELFSELINHIEEAKIKQSVTLMQYAQLKKVVEESKHVKQIYPE